MTTLSQRAPAVGIGIADGDAVGEDFEMSQEEENDDVQIVTDQMEEEELRPAASAVGAAGPSASAGIVGSSAEVSFDEDSGSTCFIYFEEYTNCGETRVVCLPCGHLFCRKCALNTVKHGKAKKRGRKKGSCPNCRKPYESYDIRNIFGSKIKMIDTTALEEARKQKEEALSMKRALQLELSTERQKNSELTSKIRRLEADINRHGGSREKTRGAGYDADIFSTGLTQADNSDLVLALKCRKEIEICKNGGSRVTDSSGYRNILLASYSSINSNSHFSSFGVRKVDLNGLRCTSSLHLHSEELRDLKFNPLDDGMVLSASKDKTLKLSSVFNNAVIHSYNHEKPVFSCCWKEGAPYHVFCGLANGRVLLYDTRAATGEQAEAVCEVTNAVSPVPVTSLHWVKRASDANAGSSGLLVGRLNSCTFYECTTASEFVAHPLPFQGNLTSLSYDSSSGYFLTSARPKLPEQPQVMHEFCEFSYENVSPDSSATVEASYSFRSVERFTSGFSQPLMTKNVLFTNPFSDQSCIAAVFNHSQGSVNLWNSQTGQFECSGKTSRDVHQIDAIHAANKCLLAVLDGHKLSLQELSHGS